MIFEEKRGVIKLVGGRKVYAPLHLEVDGKAIKVNRRLNDLEVDLNPVFSFKTYLVAVVEKAEASVNALSRHA